MTKKKLNYKKLAVFGLIGTGLAGGVLFGFIDGDEAWAIASNLMAVMGLG